MARVFLLNPPTPETVRTPLLSFCYLGAALRRAGHQVAVLDASAPKAPRTPGEIVDIVRGFAPDLCGVHVKTLYAQQSYAIAAALAPHVPLCAGGPHATVCPEEPLRHGFRFVLRGEAEATLPRLASALATGRAEGVPGLTFPGPLGPRSTPGPAVLTDLDELPAPAEALDLFDPAWYGKTSLVPPHGLLSSRGCPAACTFCCNNVTGRRFRYHSAARVAAEVAELRALCDMRAFSFFDDSFAVGRRRVAELSRALRASAPDVSWTCTAHPAHLDREVLQHMKEAGCGGVDLGIESGDPEMLLRIGKGVTGERVLAVLAWAAELGLHTVVNLMFGWPDETLAQLRATQALLQRAAPLASAFNARGVLVPYPGTEIYERHHQRHGFTEWWLREPPLDYVPFPTAWSLSEVTRAYAADAALPRNFFHHPPEVLRLIQELLDEKARLTFRAIAAGPGPAVPAAGAR